MLSAGFVHRTIHQRRHPRDASDCSLAFEEAHERLTGRSGRWQALRVRRRERGRGWTGGDADRVGLQRYTFGETGEVRVARLKQSQIRAILGRHSVAIGNCLIRSLR